jgi:hypothetical protein
MPRPEATVEGDAPYWGVLLVAECPTCPEALISDTPIGDDQWSREEA